MHMCVSLSLSLSLYVYIYICVTNRIYYIYILLPRLARGRARPIAQTKNLTKAKRGGVEKGVRQTHILSYSF